LQGKSRPCAGFFFFRLIDAIIRRFFFRHRDADQQTARRSRAAAAEAVYDVRAREFSRKLRYAMSDPVALWHAEHVNFASLLDILEIELDRFHRGQAPDYELMLDIMFYMTHYPDVLHHPREDLAFAKIAERSAEARSIVGELADQHAMLKREGNTLVIALDDIVNGAITTRDHVEAPGRGYIAAFRRHMDIEETKIMPLAATLLNPEDWTAIEIALRQLEDPVFGATRDERYAALRRRIARESRSARPARHS
jgi:hemerythrin-like domain-containing protein